MRPGPRTVTVLVINHYGRTPHKITGIDRGLERGKRSVGGQLIAPRAILRVKVHKP